MRPSGRRGIILLLGSVLLAGMGPVASGAEHGPPTASGEVAATIAHPFARPEALVSSERVPLVEIFTATWCSVCAEAERALERILEEDREGPGPAVLAYHPWPDTEDPFGFPEGHQRMAELYGAVGFPTIWIDGKWELSSSEDTSTVDVGLEQLYYQMITSNLQKSQGAPPPFELTTEWSKQEGNVTIRLDLRVLDPRSGPFVARAALWEDDLKFRGSNGIEDHRMTARALLAPKDVPFLLRGGEWTTEWTLKLPPDLEVASSGITVFIESAPAEEPEGGAKILMQYAFGVAAGTTTVVFLLRRGNVPRARNPAPPVEKTKPPHQEQDHDTP